MKNLVKVHFATGAALSSEGHGGEKTKQKKKKNWCCCFEESNNVYVATLQHRYTNPTRQTPRRPAKVQQARATPGPLSHSLSPSQCVPFFCRSCTQVVALCHQVISFLCRKEGIKTPQKYLAFRYSKSYYPLNFYPFLSDNNPLIATSFLFIIFYLFIYF